jgi:hypothetical protein
MKNAWLPVFACALILTVPQLASATDDAAKGKTLVTVDGARLGQVYRVGSDGAVQMIIGGKMITVPASTLSSVNGRLVTSLSKNEILAL